MANRIAPRTGTRSTPSPIHARPGTRTALPSRTGRTIGKEPMKIYSRPKPKTKR